MFLPDDLAQLGRVALTAVLLYLFVILVVRLVGKRVTSKMNNFDWILTVALGSIVGSTILSKSIPLANGFVAILTLVLLQYLVTKLSMHSSLVEHAVHSRPTLLYYRGRFLDRPMHKERVTREEVESAMRAAGYLSPDDVWAVILESNAELSVIGAAGEPGTALLEGVRAWPNGDSSRPSPPS